RSLPGGNGPEITASSCRFRVIARGCESARLARNIQAFAPLWNHLLPAAPPLGRLFESGDGRNDVFDSARRCARGAINPITRSPRLRRLHKKSIFCTKSPP